MLNRCVSTQDFFSPVTSIQTNGLKIVFECEQTGSYTATLVSQNSEYFRAIRLNEVLSLAGINYEPLKFSLFQREESILRVSGSRRWSKESTKSFSFECCCPVDMPSANRNNAKLIVRPFTT